MRRHEPRQVGKAAREDLGVALGPRYPIVEPLQLRPSQRRGELVGPVVPAQPVGPVGPVLPGPKGRRVLAEDRQPPGGARGLLVVRREQPALARGKVFRTVQAERPSVPEPARSDAPIQRAMCLGRVFDHGETMAGGDRADLVHVGGQAVHVDGHHGPGALGDPLLDQAVVERVNPRVDVAEHGHRARMEHRHRRGHEAEGRDDHLVARPDTRGHDGTVKGRRPAVGEQRELGSRVGRPLPLERRGLWRIRAVQHAAVEHPLERRAVSVRDLGPARVATRRHGG